MINMRAIFLVVLTLATCALSASGGGVRFDPVGRLLPGPQLKWDGGFDLLDWNGDGLPDLIQPSGGFNAYHVHLNVGARGAPAFDFFRRPPVNFTELSPFGVPGFHYTDSVEHGQAMAFGDLNGDGLFDVVLYDGRLTLAQNTGRPHAPNHWKFFDAPQRFPGSPEMLAANRRYATGPESLFWNTGIFPRQVLTVTVADWNGDSLPDLVVCRFKGEAPGVVGLGLDEHWTPFGRGTTGFGPPPVPVPSGPDYSAPLPFTPERETVVYLNTGSATAPWFDAGVEVRADGRPVAAPNPVVFDVDGDGVPDLVTSETPYASNAFRVDWPTVPHVTWFRRPGAGTDGAVEAARPLRDARGDPIPAGTQARFADLRGTGSADLLVLDPGASLRWYRNTAPPGKSPAFAAPVVLSGTDFAHLGPWLQPVVADWFGPSSRDLILHGAKDEHCKWALRRTALYRNVTSGPGDPRYAFAGWLNYRGDPTLVPQTLAFESSPYEVFGSAVSIMPGDGEKRLMMSVNRRLYLFGGLEADGLTFTQRTPLDLPAERNEMRGWQKVALDGRPVKAVRFVPASGYGILRDNGLHLVRFEALEGRTNVAVAGVATVGGQGVVNPAAMLAPGDSPGDAPPAKMTSVGGGEAALTVTFDRPRPITALRFLLSDRDRQWYEAGSPSSVRWPFYWQNRPYRQSRESGEPFYQYRVDVSTNGDEWVTADDRRTTGMHRSFPVLIDWDDDGNADLLLGVVDRYWIPAAGIDQRTVSFRLYRNGGDNAAPRYESWEPLVEDGAPITLRAANGVFAVADLDGDGKPDLAIRNSDPDTRFRVYRNVSDQPAGLAFRREGYLGDTDGIAFRDGNPRIALADVDGSGLPDLLLAPGNPYTHLVWFKGVATTAPPTIPPRGRGAAPDAGHLVLRNGPSGGSGLSAYAGTEAVWLDAGAPDAAAGREMLDVRSRRADADDPRMLLIRFAELPPIGTTPARATLELTTVVSDTLIGPPSLFDVSCYAFRHDWDGASTTFAERVAGTPWAVGELTGGGTFLSHQTADPIVARRQTLSWDVTAAPGP